MEHINKVELQGIVGNAKAYPMAGGLNVVRFSLATDYCYRSKDGMAVIDTTWHSISMLETKPNELDWIQKGTALHLTGRLRCVKFCDSNGIDRSVTEVVAEDIHSIKA
ncbi:MAG: single-stranded DNA-binding protein [Prevotella sp.]|nr:single-stranded DNA-binding protein [Prevotella sp.]